MINLQSFVKSMGKYGCYFFCILHIAEKYFHVKNLDAINIALKCIKLGYIDFDFNDYDSQDNFYIKNPAGILNVCTGRNFSVCKQPSNYKKQAGDYLIIRYAMKGKVSDGHFVTEDYDPIQNSQHKKYGVIESFRVFRELR